ncbi:DUF433 domain-containing protein [Sphingobium aromaticiconvertens]|uniref:DUF433 domain-containing protein n=1 Tax=Sphingobium aromaticiconvertens TaxID=365341 RepID=UPI003019D52D
MGDKPTVAAFGAAHIQALTGLSRYQLREWDKAGFFAPEYAYENRRVAHGRVYSFTDLVGLRTLSVLSKTHKIGLPELKRVAAKLSKWSKTPWSSLTLYVLNREVHFHNPATGKIEGAISGQMAVPIPLENVMDDMRQQADKLRERPQESVGSFERNRYRMRNAVLVAGTRIPVSAIFNYIDAGYSSKKIVEEYPDLKIADIKAALEQRTLLTQAA